MLGNRWTRLGSWLILCLSALALVSTMSEAFLGRRLPSPGDPGRERASHPSRRPGSVRSAIEAAAERDPFRADRHRGPRYQLPGEVSTPSPGNPSSKPPDFLVFGTVQDDSCGSALVAPSKDGRPRLVSCGDPIGQYVLSEIRVEDIVVRDSTGNAFTIAITAPAARNPEKKSPISVLGNVSGEAEVLLDGVRVANRAVLNSLDPRAIERVEVRKIGGRSQIAVTTKKH